MGFQQGLSGLNAASRNLDVIGNNIANSNTTGFKSSRAEFGDMVASAMGVASGQNNGMGVEVVGVAQQFTQGNITATGNSMDLAINGNGFFKVKLPSGQDAYTRAGNFQLDKNGDVRTNGGAQVMGFEVDPATGIAGVNTVPLSFPLGAPIDPKETTKITATFNLDARAKDAAGIPAIPAEDTDDGVAVPAVPPTPRSTYGTSIDVYDSEGVATQVELYFVKTSEPNTWDVYTSLAADAEPLDTQIVFDNNGKIIEPAAEEPDTGIGFRLAEIVPNNPNLAEDVTINGTAEPPGVFLSLDKVTQFGNKFAISDLKQDGYTAGNLTSINVGNDGSIVASYSNGVTRKEAQVALASFRNPQGLTPVGGNNWVETIESGVSMLGKPGDGNFGTLRSGALEDSNVDLTAELVGMMTAQRSYQANAQTIKTQDQVLSTIVNLR